MLNRFIESNDTEYKYNVLVYPNITYQKDLEKDSYVVVLCNIIRELNKIRDDIYWTIISPRQIDSLDLIIQNKSYYLYHLILML